MHCAQSKLKGSDFGTEVMVGLVGFISGVEQRACEVSAMVHEVKSQ